MTRRDDRKRLDGPAPKKRFHVRKLEERVAPKYNPQSKWVSNPRQSGGSSGSLDTGGSIF